MIPQNVLDLAAQAALGEIKKFGTPAPTQFEISNTQGQRLAELFGVDRQVVLLGTTLMDFKIGEAISQNRLPDHIAMSRDAAEELLRPHLQTDGLEKVLNCIEGHHKTAEWKYKEAEICANADCYRFLMPEGLISFLMNVGKREMKTSEAIKYALSKVEEKWKVLTSEKCRLELKDNYEILRTVLQRAL